MNIPCWIMMLTFAMGTPVLARGGTPEETTFQPNLEVVDAPTASVPYARMFHMNFRAFRGGGIMVKALASFNNTLMLGLGLKADNVIGSGSVHFDDEPVGAVARVKFISLPRTGLQVALGYDAMSYDATRQKGLYGVLSKDLGAGDLQARAHAGAGAVRFRKFNSDNDVNVFFGLSAALSEEFLLGMEYDDVLLDDGSVNASVGYSWDVGLRIELDFKGLFRGVKAYHRMLKILYTF